MGPKIHVYNHQRHKPKVKFTPEDDDMLRQAVEQFGTDNWELIATQLPNRNARQCKDGWYYYHAPGLSTNPWTPQEDQALLDAYERLGPRWVQISHCFIGRTDTHIKNRWLVLQRRMRKYGTYEDVKERKRASVSSPQSTQADAAPSPQQPSQGEGGVKEMENDVLVDFWDQRLTEEDFLMWETIF